MYTLAGFVAAGVACFLRRSLRFLFALMAVPLGGLLIRGAVAWDRCRGRDPLRGWGRICQRAWCRGFCAVFGIRVVPGERALAEPPALIAANHVSWLDIVVLAAVWPVVFLSKSEVARWPIIGGVATGLGTIYIQRGGPTAARDANRRLVDGLDAGQSIVFFPEGTTSDGTFVRAFRPRLFQSGIDAGAAIQPVSLAYRRPDGSHSSVVPFVDEQSLARNVWLIAAERRLTARVEPAEPVRPAGRKRNELATSSRAALVRQLGLA